MWVGMEVALVAYLGVLSSVSRATVMLLYFVAQVFGSFLVLIAAIGGPEGHFR